MRNRERAERDFYRTPLPAVKLAEELMDSNLKWWEPCAGDGAISDNLQGVVYASDIYPMINGIDALDMLTCDKPPNVDAVVTNPPFFAQYELLDRCLFEWKIPSLLLIRIEPLSTQKRNNYTKHLKKLHIVSSLIRFETEDGRIVNGNGTVRCGWCLFTPEQVSYTETKWVTFERNVNSLPV